MKRPRRKRVQRPHAFYRALDADKKLIVAFARRYRCRSSTYTTAEIIFQGEHLFVVRMGRDLDHARRTYLGDKIGILYDEDTPDLVKLAVEYHPAKSEAEPILVHATGEHDAVFGGRWCKSLCSKIIDWAQQKEANYASDIQPAIDAFDAHQRIMQERHNRATESLRQMTAAVTALGFKVEPDPTDVFSSTWLTAPSRELLATWLSPCGTGFKLPGIGGFVSPENFLKYCEIVLQSKSEIALQSEPFAGMKLA